MKKLVKCINKGPNPLVIAGELLEVGATHVDGEKLRAALAASEKTRKMFQAQCVLFPEQPEGQVDEVPAYAPTLIHLSTRAAREAIAACNDVEQLKRWVQDDARASVQKALHLRWRELTPEQPAGSPDIAVLSVK